MTVRVWNAMGEYCNKYRLNNGNNANHCTLNNKYEKTVVVDGNLLANTTELKIAKFNDKLGGNLHNQSKCTLTNTQSKGEPIFENVAQGVGGGLGGRLYVFPGRTTIIMRHDFNTKQSNTQSPNTITRSTLCQTFQYR
jgi:hypothetical protein